MEPVGDLDEHHADVVGNGQQQFAEVLRLLGGLVAEHAAADLRQSVHYLGDLVAEQPADVVHRIVRVLHHVVQQRRAYTGRTQTDLFHAYARDGYRVQDIRFSAQATHAVVRAVRKIKRMRDQLHFLAVRRVRIVVQQRLKLALNHLLFFLCKLTFLHTKYVRFAHTYPKYRAKVRLFFEMCKIFSKKNQSKLA